MPHFVGDGRIDLFVQDRRHYAEMQTAMSATSFAAARFRHWPSILRAGLEFASMPVVAPAGEPSGSTFGLRRGSGEP